MGLRVYAGRVIGPKVVPAGTKAFSRARRRRSSVPSVLLWLSSDWPLHDIAEQRLYSAHMFQHLLLTMIVPPLFWLATPEWLARLDRPGRRHRRCRLLRRLAKPLVAYLLFNRRTC